MNKEWIKLIAVYLICGIVLAGCVYAFCNPAKFDKVLGKNPVDAFENVKISVEGNEPDASLTIRNYNDDMFLSGIDYVPTKDSGLSNGDEITILAKYDFVKAIQEGYHIRNAKMNFTVENAGMELSTDKVPQRMQMDAIDEAFSEELEKIAEQDWEKLVSKAKTVSDELATASELSYDSKELYSAYVLKQDTSDDWFATETPNYLVCVYTMNFRADGVIIPIGICFRTTQVSIDNDLHVSYTWFDEENRYDLAGEPSTLVDTYVHEADSSFLNLKIY